MNEGKIFVDTNILVYGHDADAGQTIEGILIVNPFNKA